MFARSALVCLGALVFLQLSVFSDADVPEDAWNNVQKWLQRMIDGLEDSRTEMSSAIKKASDAEETKITKMRKTIKSEIKTEVATLQKQADKAGVNIKDCLKEVSDGGDTLADTLLKGALQCVTDEPQQDKTIESSEKDLITRLNTTWTEAKQEWDRCQSESNVVLCRGKMVGDVGVKVGDYANEYAALVKKANTFVNSVKKNMDSCVTSDIDAIPAQLASKTKQMSQCVQKKIKSD